MVAWGPQNPAEWACSGRGSAPGRFFGGGAARAAEALRAAPSEFVTLLLSGLSRDAGGSFAVTLSYGSDTYC